MRRVPALVLALFLAVALAPSAHAAPYLPPPGKVFSGSAAGTSLGSFARETGDHPVYNQGALTNGPFRLRRYPRSRAALRRALDHRRFALR